MGRPNQSFLRPLIALEKLGLEGPVSIPRDLQLKSPDPRGQLPLVGPVAVARSTVGAFSGFSPKVIGHLGLQNLVQDRFQKDRDPTTVTLVHLLDLLVRNLHLKSSHRSSALVVGLVRLTTWQNAVAFSIEPALLHKNRDTTGFRRLGGYRDLPRLKQALKEAIPDDE